MARKDNFNASMKDFPGAQRVTISGKRVWLFAGKEFSTKREMFAFVHPAPVKVLPAEVVEANESAATENTAEGWAGNPA